MDKHADHETHHSNSNGKHSAKSSGHLSGHHLSLHHHEKEHSSTYRVSWMNNGNGYDTPFALAIRKVDEEHDHFANGQDVHYFMCFRAAIQDKIEWQWFNNDEANGFSKYRGYEVFAQLEASFQANLHTNFAFNLKVREGRTPREREMDKSPFNLPCLPELRKQITQNASKEGQKKKKNENRYVMFY